MPIPPSTPPPVTITEPSAVPGTGTLSDADTADDLGRLLVYWPRGAVSAPLPTRGTLVIGRDARCDVCIPDASVSRRHARLAIGDEIAVEDLGGRNGLRVDGERLPARGRAIVRPGQVIELGAAVLLVRPVGGAPNTPAPSSRERPGSPMDRVRTLASLVAKGRIAVLLLGETGVGKEVLAERIHRDSPRAAGPFVRLNCAALPEQLLESELFGHERGAFTGAIRTKDGLLHAASGGTLMLDEVGDLPPTIQAKLLRVLESREVTRVGGVRPALIDVRFVAATNHDLLGMVRDGRFRADLYHRLAGVELRVPPLRERAAEIAPLALHFVADSAAAVGRPAMTLSPRALAWLHAQPWPGNVRQLRNAIECAVLLAPSDTIEPEHFLADERAEPVADDATLDGALAAEERRRIEGALRQTSGNQTAAARLLKITRRALVHRLGVHGLARPRRDRQK